jgi:hypothetical protein
MTRVSEKTEQPNLAVDDCMMGGQFSEQSPTASTSGETSYVSSVAIRPDLDIPQKVAAGVVPKHPAKTTPNLMRCHFCTDRQFVLHHERSGESSRVILFCDGCIFA